MIGVQRNKTVLAEHDDNWANEYLLATEEMKKLFGANALEMAHVGSTAIGGIVAKPILDIAVLINDMAAIDNEAMAAASYENAGVQDASGRVLYIKRVANDVATHHVHCYPNGSESYRTNVLFCRYLNQNPEIAKEYNDLKVTLAEKYADDRPSYTAAKSDFIEGVIAKAMAQQG